MSGTSVLAWNLAVWTLQAAVVLLAAAALERLAPIESPRVRLAFGQGLLALLVALPALQPWRRASGRVLVFVMPAGSAPGGLGSSPRGWGAPGSWADLVVALLAFGVLVQLVRLALRVGRARAIVRAARPWQAARRGCPAGELPSGARLMLSDRVAAPATVGFRRPAVLLPPRFLEMSADQQWGIVLHELFHVRHHHFLVQLLEEVLRAVLFFHPAVHWLLARIRLAREQCVDAEVVRRLGARGPYLASLVEVARFVGDARAVPAAPFLGEGHLRERVGLLLKEVFMSRTRTAIHLGLTAVAIVLAVAWAASAVPMESAKPAAGATVAIQDKASQGPALRLVKQVKPVYPEAAKKEKVEGVYRIDILIGTDGAIREARVLASAPTKERLDAKGGSWETRGAKDGDPRLAEAALQAVRQWQYQPVLKDGKPVEAHATVTVAFKLDEKEGTKP